MPDLLEHRNNAGDKVHAGLARPCGGEVDKQGRSLGFLLGHHWPLIIEYDFRNRSPAARAGALELSDPFVREEALFLRAITSSMPPFTRARIDVTMSLPQGIESCRVTLTRHPGMKCRLEVCFSASTRSDIHVRCGCPDVRYNSRIRSGAGECRT